MISQRKLWITLSYHVRYIVRDTCAIMAKTKICILHMIYNILDNVYKCNSLSPPLVDIIFFSSLLDFPSRF